MCRFHHGHEHTSNQGGVSGVVETDRNVATLDRPDNRRAEKGSLKDSIVLEPVEPELRAE